MINTIKPDRITAIDLTSLSDEEMTALRQEAMKRGISMSELLTEFVIEVTRRQAGSNEAIAHQALPEHYKN